MSARDDNAFEEQTRSNTKTSVSSAFASAGDIASNHVVFRVVGGCERDNFLIPLPLVF